jgi:hypothetical protein
VLRETLVEAREHAFYSAMQALEVQTLQLADACAAANDGVLAKVANIGHATIKRLPKELRDLAKVPHAFRNEFRKQAARAAGAQASDGAADSRTERMAVLAARTAVLDNIEPQARAWAAEGYLQERLHAAESELRDAQVRAMVVMVAATVVQVAAGNFAGAAAGRLAQAAMVGRGAVATDLVVGAATIGGDLVANTAFQKAVDGDDASVLTIAGLNVANAAVMKVISRGFASLGAIESASMRNATLWQRLGPRAAQLGMNGLELTSEMIAGAAVDYASRKVAGEHTTDPGDMTAEEWLLQGAAMGLGRFIAARTQRIADRSFRTFRDRVIADRATALVHRAQTIGDTGSVEAANAMLAEYHVLIELESAHLETMLTEQAARGGHVPDALVEDLRANTRVADHLDALEPARPGAGTAGGTHVPPIATTPAPSAEAHVAAARPGAATPDVASEGAASAPSPAAAHQPQSPRPPDLETPPRLQHVEHVTGVAKGPAYEQAMTELSAFYAVQEVEAGQVTQTRGHVVDGPYFWDYGHDARRFGHGAIHIAFRVHVTPAPGVDAAQLAHLQRQVVAGVDQHYNFRPISDGERLHLDVEFVDDLATAHLRIWAHAGDGDANLYEWFVEGDPTTHAHEVTHGAFGAPDEYADPLGQAPGRAHATDVNVSRDGSLMGDYWQRDAAGRRSPAPGTGLRERHFDRIRAQLPGAPDRTATPPPAPHLAPLPRGAVGARCAARCSPRDRARARRGDHRSIQAPQVRPHRDLDRRWQDRLRLHAGSRGDRRRQGSTAREDHGQRERSRDRG